MRPTFGSLFAGVGGFDLEVERLRALLGRARRGHYYCDDCWYSCPKATDGCCDDSQGDECNCGADAWNAEIDAVWSGQQDTERTEP